MLYKHIVADVRRINEGHKNSAVNKTLQNFLYSMLTDDNKIAAKMSLDAMIELYHRKVWNDTKTVNVIVTACFSPITKIMVAAIKFFLGTDEPDRFDKEEKEEGAMDEYQRVLKVAEFQKDTKKKRAKVHKAVAALNRKNRKNNKAETFNFSALHLVNDPQGMAERLFAMLKGSNEAFEVKLMMMNLISRLIGLHKVC
jgi:protein SDA1